MLFSLALKALFYVLKTTILLRRSKAWMAAGFTFAEK
jgi:hypothetical protein